jgi:hypothetical protein
MSLRFPLTHDQQQLCDEVAAEAMQVAFLQFGQTWVGDKEAPSAAPDEVARIRREFAMPIAVGLMVAAARFVWITAPPDGNAQALADTMSGTGLEAAAIVAADEGLSCGSFWRELLARGGVS